MPEIKRKTNGKKMICLARMSMLIVVGCFLSVLFPPIVWGGLSSVKSHSDQNTDPSRSVLPEDWLSLAQEEILKKEYAITRQTNVRNPHPEDLYQSPNRRHGFRVHYTADGIRLRPRAATGPHWEWGLKLHSYGYDGDLRRVVPAKRSALGNRMTFKRPSFLEWYVNDAKGLEQGFLLDGPPSGKPSTEIQFKMEVTGDLVGTLSHGEVRFRNANGMEVLHYGKLHAFDAFSVPLPTRFELKNKVLSVFVQVAAARYPIMIDPLVTHPGSLLSGGQAEAAYGFSVATAGDVNGDGFSDILIGAPEYEQGEENEGAAFVYFGSAEGLSATPDWVGEGNQAEAAYGFSVATAGDVNGDGFSDIVIGAPGYEQGETNEGAAFVYFGGAEGLSLIPDWVGEGNRVASAYGSSVAPAGDVNDDGYSDLVIGAFQYDGGETNEGAAFVYLGGPNGVAASAHWIGEGNQVEAAYGASVGTAGDVNGDGYSDLVIGAPLYDQGQTDEGAAFVYLGGPNGVAASAHWTGESDQVEANYGVAVGTAGDVNGDGYSDVIVGADLYENLDLFELKDEGRSFVYHGSASGLEPDAVWRVDGRQFRSHFGASVSSAGDLNGDGYADVIVGAPLYDNGEENEGRIRFFLGTAEGLEVTGVLIAEGNQRLAQYGASVAAAGDVNGDGYADVIVGAHRFENTLSKEGAAFLHFGGASGPEKVASFRAEGEQTDSNFGISVASAGDVNGDGYADVLVGASLFDKGEIDEGLVFLYLGSAEGFALEADWIAEGNQVAAGFGGAVASAGDVNGDGYADVLVGARLYDNGEIDEGLVFLYLGSAEGLSQNADWTAEGNQIASNFGSAVASAGDVNGDGYADVIVGAEAFDFTETDEGGVFVYLGSVRGLSLSADWMVVGEQAASGFGVAVASVGDVNGDGFSDIAIAADLYDGEDVDEGLVSLYQGSAQGLSLIADWSVEGNQPASGFGRTLASAGDVNGDGFSDLLVGARFYDQDYEQEGGAFLYLGAKAGLSLTPDWQSLGGQFGAEFGTAVASAGDVNGDGYADVLIGASLFTQTRSDEGAAFLFLGGFGGLQATADWEVFGRQLDARFGVSVASAGDVNGDGYADLIVGAHHFDNGKSNEGGLFLYYGNGGRGVSLLPRQVRHDNSALISPLGFSDRSNAFRLSSLSRSPFGGTSAKLEWEIKPFGKAFDGLQIVQSETWVKTDLRDPEINVSILNLLPKTRYHWRLRLEYDLASSPYQQRSRWFTPSNNAWSLADFKTRTGFLIAPAEGERGLPSTVTFLWEKVALSNGNAADYQFCLKAGEGAFNESRDCSEIKGTQLLKTVFSQNAEWLGFAFVGMAFIFFGSPFSKNPKAQSVFVRQSFLGLFVFVLLLSCRSGGGGDDTAPSPPLTTTEIRHTVSDLSAETSYRWKVLVQGEERVVDVSEVRTFYTE